MIAWSSKTSTWRECPKPSISVNAFMTTAGACSPLSFGTNWKNRGRNWSKSTNGSPRPKRVRAAVESRSLYRFLSVHSAVNVDSRATGTSMRPSISNMRAWNDSRSSNLSSNHGAHGDRSVNFPSWDGITREAPTSKRSVGGGSMSLMMYKILCKAFC